MWFFYLNVQRARGPGLLERISSIDVFEICGRVYGVDIAVESAVSVSGGRRKRGDGNSLLATKFYHNS